MGTKVDTTVPLPVLLRTDRDGIATLTLNRPEQYNALSQNMLGSLQTELDEIAGNELVRAVIIGGKGDAYCAGHDLKDLWMYDCAYQELVNYSIF